MVEIIIFIVKLQLENLNYKPDYNKKNHAHMKKVGHTSEFPFGIY